MLCFFATRLSRLALTLRAKLGRGIRIQFGWSWRAHLQNPLTPECLRASMRALPWARRDSPRGFAFIMRVLGKAPRAKLSCSITFGYHAASLRLLAGQHASPAWPSGPGGSPLGGSAIWQLDYNCHKVCQVLTRQEGEKKARTFSSRQEGEKSSNLLVQRPSRSGPGGRSPDPHAQGQGTALALPPPTPSRFIFSHQFPGPIVQ